MKPADLVTIVEDVLVVSADWDEGDHPRDDAGKFTDGGKSGYVTTVKAERGSGSADIYRNPSRDSLTKLMHQTQYGEARGILHNGNVYVWSADVDVLHSTAKEAMKLEGETVGVYFRKEKNGLFIDRAVLGQPWPEGNSWLEKYKEKIKPRF